MRKIFTLVCMALAANFAFAEVFLEENFDYPIGDKITDHGWYTEYGSASEIGVTNGLSLPHYAPSNTGNAALIDCESSGTQAHKAFKEVTESDVYTAFMLLPSINYKKGYFFTLRDKNTRTEYNFNARVFIDADYHIGLTFADNKKAVFSEETLDYATPCLVVVKYSIQEGENNDCVSLYLLKETAREEPATPTIGPLYDGAKKDINPANIVLRGYDSDGWLVVDGIRVASSWQEAVLWNGDTGIDIISGETGNSIGFLYNCLGTCLGEYSEELLQRQPHGVYVVKRGNSSQKVLR